MSKSGRLAAVAETVSAAAAPSSLPDAFDGMGIAAGQGIAAARVAAVAEAAEQTPCLASAAGCQGKRSLPEERPRNLPYPS